MYPNQFYPQPIQPMQLSYVSNQLIRVAGLDGAKAYQVGANSSVALFDQSADVFYVKSTDMAGFPTIRAFKFEEISQDIHKVSQDLDKTYVSRKEMEDYVKLIIQQQSTTGGSQDATNQSTAGADD